MVLEFHDQLILVNMKIVLNKGQQIYFTSDTHYSHSNICKSTSRWPESDKTRDFESLEAMNNAIVERINASVGENDILFHLGDWSFGGFDMIREFREKIICKNVHIILGNHDHHIDNNKGDIRSIFTSVNHYLFLTVVRQGANPNKDKGIKDRFILCHFPIASWNGLGDGVMHLHGHVHLPPDKKIADGRAMDVGMDGNYLDPYSLDEVIDLLKDRPKLSLRLPNDHHENDL